jgi:hypothetical protein
MGSKFAEFTWVKPSEKNHDLHLGTRTLTEWTATQGTVIVGADTPRVQCQVGLVRSADTEWIGVASTGAAVILRARAQTTGMFLTLNSITIIIFATVLSRIGRGLWRRIRCLRLWNRVVWFRIHYFWVVRSGWLAVVSFVIVTVHRRGVTDWLGEFTLHGADMNVSQHPTSPYWHHAPWQRKTCHRDRDYALENGKKTSHTRNDIPLWRLDPESKFDKNHWYQKH